MEFGHVPGLHPGLETMSWLRHSVVWVLWHRYAARGGWVSVYTIAADRHAALAMAY